MKNCLTRKNEKMCDPISGNSTENATPSSGTSPLASYKEVPLPRAEIDNRAKPGFKYYKTYWTFLCFTSSHFIYMRILWLEIKETRVLFCITSLGGCNAKKLPELQISHDISSV